MRSTDADLPRNEPHRDSNGTAPDGFELRVARIDVICLTG